MIVYSTHTRPGWTMSQHSQLRAYERGISRREVFAVLNGTHYSLPSCIAGSSLRTVTGLNGVRLVVDQAWHRVVTVYRMQSM